MRLEHQEGTGPEGSYMLRSFSAILRRHKRPLRQEDDLVR